MRDRIILDDIIEQGATYELGDLDTNIFSCTSGQQQFFCSQNNSAYREMLEYTLGEKFRGVNDKLLEDRELLDAELAVFAGNFYRLLLGDHQPFYKLAKVHDFSSVTDSDYMNEFDHPYFRVCSIVDNFTHWDDAFNETNQIALNNNMQPQGLSRILIAGYFLGEIDWSGMNFGFDGSGQAVRLDPGLAFSDVFFSNNVDKALKNPLINFIGKMPEEDYLPQLIEFNESDQCKIIHKDAKKLFCNQREIEQMLRKISALSPSDFDKLVKQSFTPLHYPIAKLLVKYIYKRQFIFKEALDKRLAARASSAARLTTNPSANSNASRKRVREAPTQNDNSTTNTTDNKKTKTKPANNKTLK